MDFFFSESVLPNDTMFRILNEFDNLTVLFNSIIQFESSECD